MTLCPLHFSLERSHPSSPGCQVRPCWAGAMLVYCWLQHECGHRARFHGRRGGSQLRAWRPSHLYTPPQTGTLNCLLIPIPDVESGNATQTCNSALFPVLHHIYCWLQVYCTVSDDSCLFILVPNTDMESGNETEEEDKMALAAVRNRALYVIAKQHIYMYIVIYLVLVPGLKQLITSVVLV